ncbi:hypothetical protein BDN67DRAFT_964576 [Paxillus ammoniavirescens]|nr:hypothetical protein BDN67DRAFT_964576 [Paxillus ammoniavirescens]
MESGLFVAFSPDCTDQEPAMRTSYVTSGSHRLPGPRWPICWPSSQHALYEHDYDNRFTPVILAEMTMILEGSTARRTPDVVERCTTSAFLRSASQSSIARAPTLACSTATRVVGGARLRGPATPMQRKCLDVGPFSFIPETVSSSLVSFVLRSPFSNMEPKTWVAGRICFDFRHIESSMN